MTDFEPTPGQQKLLDAPDARILVLGGPGSGKTAAALMKARQIVTESGAPRRVLFLTFSRAAVSELTSRLPGALGDAAGRVDIQTFHAFAVGLLDSFGRYAGYGSQPVTIVTRAEDALELRPEGGVRYDELVPRALEVLRGSPWIGKRFLSRYGAVISDEFQDTGDEQAELLELLASRSRLICLADPRQLIFDWMPGNRGRRLAEFRASGPREINLGDVSQRDPSTLIPRLAMAIVRQDVDSDVFDEAISAGRFRVIYPSADVYVDVVEEIKRLRRSGATSVGIFLMQRFMVDELAEALAWLGIRHEITGLQEATAEAEVAIAALARFASGTADWDSVVARLAVFLYESRRRRDDLPRRLLRDQALLPERPRTRLAALRDAASAASEVTIADFLPFARAAWASLLLGGSPRLWELGADDLRGQSVGVRHLRLRDGGAAALSEFAARQRMATVAQMLAGQQSPVRLMTRPQAKGREMDAVLLVNHPDDFEKPESTRNDRRVMFVMVTRARRSVTLVLRPDPTPLFAPFTEFAHRPEA